MARIVNPQNIDVDDDAVFMGALNQGLIWIEDDDERDSYPDLADVIPVQGVKSRTLQGHKSRINSLATSKNILISASADSTLCVWKWQTGQHLRTLTGHTSSVNSVTINGDFAISVSTDKTIRVWNWRSGEQVRIMTGPSHSLSALDIDNEIIVTASFGEVWVWNWQTGEHLKTLKNTWSKSGHHQNSISLVALDGDNVLSYSSQPDIIIVRNWKTEETFHQLRMEDLVDEECSIDIVGNVVAVLDDNNPDIILWDWKSGKHLNLDTEGGYVGNFQFVEDRSHVIRGGENGDIHIFRFKSFFHDLTLKSEEPVDQYNISEILAEVGNFIRGRDEQWVNFTRVDQHIRNRFSELDLRKLKGTSKKYKHLRKLTEDYPQQFLLRPDEHKSGLFYIRLANIYGIDHILAEVSNFIRGRGEQWVNFTRVDQHIRNTFPQVDLRQLKGASKKYKHLRKLAEDYPQHFTLREDQDKPGLFYIRLAD